MKFELERNCTESIHTHTQHMHARAHTRARSAIHHLTGHHDDTQSHGKMAQHVRKRRLAAAAKGNEKVREHRGRADDRSRVGSRRCVLARRHRFKHAFRTYAHTRARPLLSYFPFFAFFIPRLRGRDRYCDYCENTHAHIHTRTRAEASAARSFFPLNPKSAFAIPARCPARRRPRRSDPRPRWSGISA